jgi:hypothetical protein
MDELEAKRAKQVEKYSKKRGLQTQVITDETIIADFVQAAYELPGSTEKDAIAAVAQRYDLFDVGGQPKNAWAAHVISEGKKVYRRTKKEAQEYEEIEPAFNSSEQ